MSGSNNYDVQALIKAAAGGMLVLLVLAVVGQLDCLQCLTVPGTLITLVAIGWFYGRFAKEKGVRAEIVPSALFGGLAAALASAIPLMLAISIGMSPICAPFLVFCGMIPVFVFGAIGGTLYGMANS